MTRRWSAAAMCIREEFWSCKLVASTIPVCRCTQLLFDDSNTTRLKVTAIAQIVISLLHNFQGLEVGDVSEPHQNGCKEPAKHLRTDAHKHPLPPNVPHHCPRQCDCWIVKACTIWIHIFHQRYSLSDLQLVCPQESFKARIWGACKSSKLLLHRYCKRQLNIRTQFLPRAHAWHCGTYQRCDPRIVGTGRRPIRSRKRCPETQSHGP